jgi:hypothetical protein
MIVFAADVHKSTHVLAAIDASNQIPMFGTQTGLGLQRSPQDN